MFICYTNSFNSTLSELDLNSCSDKPCKNNGTCVQKSNGQFNCTCSGFFGGELCQKSQNPCLVNDCSGNGVCRPITSDEYECECDRKCNTLIRMFFPLE